MIIFFRGKSSEKDHGVEFQVSDRGTDLSTLRPNMISLDVSTPFNYKFPPLPLTEYGANERLFVIIKGAIGMRTKVKITDFSSEECCDWLKAPYLNTKQDYILTNYTVRAYG